MTSQYMMPKGFPHGIERVLDFKIGFQDFEKVLNLTEIYKN